MRRTLLSFSLVATITAGALTTPVPASAQQVLRVASNALPPGRGNPFTAIGSPSIWVWSAIFDSLTQVDEKGVTQPMLALSWKAVDRNTWRFELRPNVRFSNGEPFTAAAVVATFDYLRGEAGAASVVGAEVRNIAGAAAIAPMSVEFRTKTPDPILPNRVAVVPIVAPGHWAKAGPEGFAREPVGTGSFRVATWTPTEVSLSAVADSWRKPRVDRLVVLGVQERPTRVQALQSGQVDIAVGLSPDNLPQVKSAGARIDSSPAPQVMSLAFFSEAANSPLKDKRVRQALNHAVDKETIAKVLLADLAKPAGQGATQVAIGYNPSVRPYPYDPGRARKLLAEAGFANGFAFTAEVVVGSFPADSEIYQQMAADLGKVGVKVTLQQIAFPDWLKKYTSNGWAGAAFGLSWNTAPVLDLTRPAALFSCLKKPAFFCDPDAAKRIEAANVEFDAKKRLGILHELARVTNENPPALFLVEQVDFIGVSGKVAGFQNHNRSLNYHEMTVAR